MNKIKILPIPHDFLGALWPHAVPHLSKGLSVATNTNIEELTTELLENKATLWCIMDGMEVVASFITSTYRDEKTGKQFLGVYALGGSGLSDWAEQLGETMARHARQSGVSSVKFAGRQAWARVLPTYRMTGRMNGEAVFERATT